MNQARRIELARACFLRACHLDVAVRKPGNVSFASPGHRMHGGLFLASAQAAAAPLFEPGARVGARIEAALAASWAVAGCNTNLGIVLLCAPIAAAAEREQAWAGAPGLRGAVEAVLAGLDLDDARAAYRAIAMANPAGLGEANAEDVRFEPSLNLRAAMALAADRDSIARQYANGCAELFEIAVRFAAAGRDVFRGGDAAAASAAAEALVQRIFLQFLSRFADSHIVRKHGEVVAHTVMRSAQAWASSATPNDDPAFAVWDESLKRQGINPGTSADLTVAALLLAGVLAGGEGAWHGS